MSSWASSNPNKPQQKLSLGLNLKPKKRTTAFNDDDDHPIDQPPPAVVAKKQPNASTNAHLLALQQPKTNKTAHIHEQALEQALEQDKHVFEYDKVYEAMKANSVPTASTSQSTEPRYIDQLLKSAQVRKLNLLKSQINKYKADSQSVPGEEAFITSSYKSTLEQFKVMEEELEQQQSSGTNGQSAGLHNMYRDYLNQSDTSARRALEPLEDTSSIPAEPVTRPESSLVNDSGEVVDKRTLLVSNGLTLRAKPVPTPRAATVVHKETAALYSSRPAGSVPHMMENPSTSGPRTDSTLLAQPHKRPSNEEEHTSAPKSVKKDESVISSARERYLARKQAAAASSPAPK